MRKKIFARPRIGALLINDTLSERATINYIRLIFVIVQGHRNCEHRVAATERTN
jgi:hypothetical protein